MPGGNNNPLSWLVTALLGIFVFAPVAMLVIGSFSQARLPTDFSVTDLSLDNYATVYTDPLTYSVFINSLIFVGGSLFFGLSIAAIFAFLVARTDLPLKPLAYIGIPVTLAMPGLLEAMAWALLFSPRMGYANQALQEGLGLESPPFDVYTMGGMVALESLRVVPTAFLMFLPLLIRFDPALEEAAAMSGARGSVVLRRITLGLMRPGLIAVALYQAVNVLSSFEVPGILGLPAQVYVFSTLVYTYSTGSTGFGHQFGLANAVAMVYLAVAVLGLWIYARATRGSARYAVVTGRGYRPRILGLGSWRWIAFAGVIVYLTASLIVPVATLLWTSFTPFIMAPSAEAFQKLSLFNWQRLLSSEALSQTILNTFVLVLVVSTVALIMSVVVAWITTRTTFRGKHLLDQLAFISHGVPAVIIALSLIWFWLQVDIIPLYGTLWIIMLGLLFGFLAYGTRSMAAALVQIHPDLEDAAYMSGASLRKTIRRVFVPLLAPALVGLWIWVALHAMRFTTVPLMLETGRHNAVLATYLWRQWGIGEIGVVAATGVAMVTAMLGLTLLAVKLGLGRLGAASAPS